MSHPILTRLREVESQARACADECRSAHLMAGLSSRPVQLVEATLKLGNIKLYVDSIEDALASVTEASAMPAPGPCVMPALADCVDADCPIHHGGCAPFCPNDLEARERFMNFNEANKAELEGRAVA